MAGYVLTDARALIGMARQRGLIASARQVFEQLHQSDFRISPQVIKTVLQRVGEL